MDFLGVVPRAPDEVSPSLQKPGFSTSGQLTFRFRKFFAEEKKRDCVSPVQCKDVGGALGLHSVVVCSNSIPVVTTHISRWGQVFPGE